MACKKALQETDDNQEEAIEVLRKKGEAKVADQILDGTATTVDDY